MTRRGFVAGAAAVVTAAGNARIRVGMLGTRHSHFKGKLAVIQQSAEYEVGGVCELDSAAAPQMLDDATIRLIVVECAPWEAVAWGKKVIAAGKHLHLEKPPGDQMEPFRELVEEARRRKLLVQLGYIWRFHTLMNQALDIARRGYLGDIFQVKGAIHTDIAPNRRGDLAKYRGGMMFELGCHLIDRVVDLLGRPKEVRSWLRHDTRIADTLADNTLAVLEYDKTLAVVTSAARQAGASEHRSFEIIGTEGSLTLQPIEPGTKMRLTLRDARGLYKAGAQEITGPPSSRYAGDFADLARAIRSAQPLKFSYDHELLVEETLLRAC
jgi:predicted dehydrogenase